MFQKKDSLALKGIAILMMLWHHCFLADRIADYNVSFAPFSVTPCTDIANFFKLCVSIFAFISGYGLYLSLKSTLKHHSSTDEAISRWLYSRLVKGLASFWFVLLLSWLITFMIDQRPLHLYFSDGIISGLLRMTLEFFGVSSLFGLTPLISTWWYMSASVVYIFLAPFFFLLLHKTGSAAVLAMLFILPRLLATNFSGEIFGFLPVFVIGMIIAKEDLLNPPTFSTRRKILTFFLLIPLCILGFLLYQNISFSSYWDIKRALCPLPFILFATLFLIRIPFLRQILVFLGKHSTNIFLVHNFFRAIYMQKFIYSFGHAGLILLVLLGISLLTSFAIEGLKKLVHYDSFISRLSEL